MAHVFPNFLIWRKKTFIWKNSISMWLTVKQKMESEKFRLQISSCLIIKTGTNLVPIVNTFFIQKTGKVSLSQLLWQLLDSSCGTDWNWPYTTLYPTYLYFHVIGSWCSGYNNQENCGALRCYDFDRKSLYSLRYAGSCRRNQQNLRKWGHRNCRCRICITKKDTLQCLPPKSVLYFLDIFVANVLQMRCELSKSHRFSPHLTTPQILVKQGFERKSEFRRLSLW